jgi:hypothetical protein
MGRKKLLGVVQSRWRRKRNGINLLRVLSTILDIRTIRRLLIGVNRVTVNGDESKRSQMRKWWTNRRRRIIRVGRPRL